MTKVLRRLGLEDGLIATGIKSQRYVSRAWDTGQTLYEMVFDAENEERFGGPYLNIHRGDLHAVLERAVTPGTIAFDHRVVDSRETGDSIQTRLCRRLDRRGGYRRRRRRHSLQGARIPARFRAAAVRRRGRISRDLPGGAARRIPGRLPDCTKWWGRDRHCLPYFLTSRRDEVYAIGVVPASGWDSDEPSVPSTREQYLQSFAGFHPDLQRVLGSRSIT